MLARASWIGLGIVITLARTVLAEDAPISAHATLADDDTGIGTEVSLGAGGNSTGNTYTVARLQLATALVRPTPPVDALGLSICDPNPTRGCMWAFSGPGSDAIEGIGAHADAELLVPQTRTTATGEVWARWGGWYIAGRASLQPDNGMRAPIWRSGRGIFERRLIFDMPAFWAIGTRRAQLLAMPAHVELARRIAFDNGARRNAGFDRDIYLSAFRILTRRLRLDVGHIGLHDVGLETSTGLTEYGPVTYGNSATILNLKVADITVLFGHGISARAEAGVRMLMPVAPFERKGSSEHSSGPMINAPLYWGELSHETRNGSLTVGGGAWSRLEPTAHAVDVGHLGTAELARDHGRFSMRAELGLGKLRRVVVGLQAPTDIAPYGTRMWMGRALLGASYAIRHDLAIEATAWAERSDRDDPRLSDQPPTGEPTSRMGADVSAAWRFARKRRPRG